MCTLPSTEVYSAQACPELVSDLVPLTPVRLFVVTAGLSHIIYTPRLRELARCLFIVK
jgi:hypothetical protein